MTRNRLRIATVPLLALAALTALAARCNGNHASNNRGGSLPPGSGNFATINFTLSDGRITSSANTFAAGST